MSGIHSEGERETAGHSSARPPALPPTRRGSSCTPAKATSWIVAFQHQDREPALRGCYLVLARLQQVGGNLVAFSRTFRDTMAVAAPETGVERDA